MKSLDIRNCFQVKLLDISDSSIEELKINYNLNELKIYKNKSMTNLDVTNSNLQMLLIADSNLENININSNLLTLHCINCPLIRNLQIDENLVILNLNMSNIESLVTGYNLEELHCSYTSKLKVINISKSNKLRYLNLNYSAVEILESNKNINRTKLHINCSNTENLRILNLSDCKYIFSLYLNNSNIEYLNLDNVEIEHLDCSNTLYLKILKLYKINTLLLFNSNVSSIYGLVSNKNLTFLNISMTKNIDYLCLKNTNLKKIYLDYSNLELLDLNENLEVLSAISTKKLKKIVFKKCNNLKSVNLKHSNIEKFLICQYLGEYIDEVNFSYTKNLGNLPNFEFKKIHLEYSGIYYFNLNSNLITELNCENTKNLTYVDVSNCINLKKLILNYSHVDTIFLNKDISYLECNETLFLKELDTSNCNNLEFLSINGSKLKKLIVNKNLKKLECKNLTLDTLDLNNSKIEIFNCQNSFIQNFNLENSKLIDEINSVFPFWIENLNLSKTKISSLPYIKGLKYLNYSFVIGKRMIYLPAYKDLIELDITESSIRKISDTIYNNCMLKKIKLNKNLKTFICNSKYFTSIDFSPCLNLEFVRITNSDLEEVNIISRQLVEIECKTKKLNVNYAERICCKNIENISFFNVKELVLETLLYQLDLSNLEIEYLKIKGENLKHILLPISVTFLEIRNTQIENINFNQIPNLLELKLINNKIKNLQLSLSSLKILECDNEILDNAYLDKCHSLEKVFINKLNGEFKINKTIKHIELNSNTHINLNHCLNLEYFNISGTNSVTYDNISISVTNTELELQNSVLYRKSINGNFEYFNKKMNLR
jgi:hypothetical protein